MTAAAAGPRLRGRFVKQDLSERFMSYVEIAPGGCWRWTGKLDSHGYGQFTVDSRTCWAHRVAYELFVGPIPDELTLDHVCHTNDESCPGGDTCSHRACVNPAHLEPVTRRVNILRGQCPAAKQARQTHCKHGHTLSGENLYYSSSGGRGCRACRRLYNHLSYMKRKASK